MFTYHKPLLCIPVDYVFILDILEHCPLDEIEDILEKISYNKHIKGVLIRIPVSQNEGEDFYLDISKNDKTHIQIHSKHWWEQLFNKFGLFFDKTIDEENIHDSKGFMAWLLKIKK